MRHKRPFPVNRVGKLKPVKRLLEGGCSNGQEREQGPTCLYDVDGSLQEEGGAVRGKEVRPQEIQVATPTQ